MFLDHRVTVMPIAYPFAPVFCACNLLAGWRAVTWPLPVLQKLLHVCVTLLHLPIQGLMDCMSS